MDTHRTIDAIWRIESSRIIAHLTRMVRDIGLAEDLAQDALVAALERWPETGMPENPGGWLMTVAKRKALDMLRRNKLRDRKYELIGGEQDPWADSEPDVPEAGEVGDDLLRLIFMTCHPVLSPEARVALTLRPSRRAHDGRDRPCLPDFRGNRRPADRPCEADAVRDPGGVRNSARPGA